MATAFRWGTLGLVRHLFESGTCTGLSDARLLERFVTHRDEAAFAALVARHGSLVLNTCQTVLKDLNAADDAFQATFVLLFRKAGSIRDRDAVGAWLHRVAYRTALEAQSAAARRRDVEQAAGRLRGVETRPPDDSGAVLHEEIERLPDRFRLPVVLCDLQGLTRDQAADHLGCTEGALRNRLAKGRDLLRRRLTRRGITGAVPFVAPPSLPESLVATTLRAAAGDASEAVATLVTAAMRGWILGRFSAAAVVIPILALGTAVALWGAGLRVPGGIPPTTGPQPVQAPAAPPQPRRHPLPLSDRRRPPRSPPSPKRSPSAPPMPDQSRPRGSPQRPGLVRRSWSIGLYKGMHTFFTVAKRGKCFSSMALSRSAPWRASGPTAACKTHSPASRPLVVIVRCRLVCRPLSCISIAGMPPTRRRAGAPAPRSRRMHRRRSAA